MSEENLEKRYRGLHYEVGRLPSWLSSSRVFWRMPHDARRRIYKLAIRGGSEALDELRNSDPVKDNQPSLKPFLRTRSIFLHVPKAAGVAVGLGLYGRKSGDHRTIADYKLCFSEREFTSFFKFTFVRNPWGRLLSAYEYLKAGGRNAQDQAWAQRHLTPYASFSEFVQGWVREENIRLGLHFRPQHEFLGMRGSRLEVDYVGYFENLQEDYDRICKIIGGGAALSAVNQSRNRIVDYRSHYDHRTRAIVESVYREDIQMFGYSFDGSFGALYA